MPDSPVFLDSNIIIYAYSSTDPKKASVCRKAIASGNVVISAQVINEFVSVAHKKFHHPFASIEAAVRELLPFVHVASLSAETSLLAIRLAEKFNLSWYDSLIIASAIENGCSLLFSEDMQHGMVMEGLTIINPFKTAEVLNAES